MSIVRMTAEEHRNRLQNLKDASIAVQSCMREHTIYDYMPGQVNYNMGEYPKRFSMAPTEYDNKLLKELAEHGVRGIGVHEEWSDPLCVLGADKFTAHDPEGLKAFVKLVHSFGMKITVYASTGYFYIHDPNFRKDWTSYRHYLVDLYCKYAQCSPASPEWRAYLLPMLERILDLYGVDGFYNDMGYEPLYSHQFAKTGPYPPDHPYEDLPFMPDSHFKHVSPGPETPDEESAIEDLLGIVYNMVHRRGGIYRVHAGGTGKPNCKSKVYDYLWVGEDSRSLDTLLEKTKDHPPYVIPCVDLRLTPLANEDELYLCSIPFMQFPLRLDGRPFTGERALVPGIECAEKKPTTILAREVWEYYQKRPDAYPSFGFWDSCPGRPEGRKRWFYHLSLYLPMVKEGTKVWIDIDKSGLFRRDLAEGVTASLFVNDEVYLVLANYGKSPAEVASAWNWLERETGKRGEVWVLPPRKILFLQRIPLLKAYPEI